MMKIRQNELRDSNKNPDMVQRLQDLEKELESYKQKCEYLQEQVNKRTIITFRGGGSETSKTSMFSYPCFGDIDVGHCRCFATSRFCFRCLITNHVRVILTMIVYY